MKIGSIAFVTHNKHKYEEAVKLAEDYNIEVTWANIEYEEIQNSELEKIAEKSCVHVKEKKLVEGNFFVEDAGLFIEELKGFPGPYSSYVFKTIGNEGILKLMEKKENRKAYFKSVIAAYIEGQIQIFTGITRGIITQELRGNKGFGFDPIFIPIDLLHSDYPLTYAQLSIESKNLYSHRQKSLRELYSSLCAFAQ